MYLKKNKQSSLALLLGKLLIIAILISGCLDQIDFDRPDTIEDGVAIQGKLVRGTPNYISCLLYTSPSPRDATLSRMPSSA